MLRKFNININGKDYIVKLEEIGVPQAPVQAAPVQPAAQPAQTVPAPVAAPAPAQPVISGEGVTIEAPMPGSVLDVLVKAGDQVTVDQCLVVLEAMKMENEIVAPKAGVVSAVHVTAGSSIDVGKPMITIV